MDDPANATDDTSEALDAGDPPASATVAPAGADTTSEAVEEVEAANGDADAATADPATNEQGFAMLGDYPLNHRLRAEALATAGVATDPDGAVSDELIAATKDRLAQEKADAASSTPSLKWTRDQLVAEANRVGAAFEADATKPTILSAITAKTEA